jgi:hypothetical protein
VIIHQSMLAAWARCPAAAGYQNAGLPRRVTSAMAYGTVMHHALLTLETRRAAGDDDPAALAAAIEAFTFYWSPLNIAAIGEPVSPDGWLPRQSWADLALRGPEALTRYVHDAAGSRRTLLAAEYPFVVPLAGTFDAATGLPHQLAGTVDRLALETWRGQPILVIGDYKTGAKPSYLRAHQQFTAYALASTCREFWTGTDGGEDGFGSVDGGELYERFRPLARRGSWIDVSRGTEDDAGWRGQADYARFLVAVTQITESIAADIHPLNLIGDVCVTCEYTSVCAGVGVPGDDVGRPEPRRTTRTRT